MKKKHFITFLIFPNYFSAGNQISELRRDDLRSLAASLKTLDLSGNSLASVPEGIFWDLQVQGSNQVSGQGGGGGRADEGRCAKTTIADKADGCTFLQMLHLVRTAGGRGGRRQLQIKQ